MRCYDCMVFTYYSRRVVTIPPAAESSKRKEIAAVAEGSSIGLRSYSLDLMSCSAERPRLKKRRIIESDNEEQASVASKPGAFLYS